MTTSVLDLVAIDIAFAQMLVVFYIHALYFIAIDQSLGLFVADKEQIPVAVGREFN